MTCIKGDKSNTLSHFFCFVFVLTVSLLYHIDKLEYI